MTDKKISQLTGATTPLSGAEEAPIVQSSATVKVSVANLTAGRAVSAASYTPTGSATPTNGIYSPATNQIGIANNGVQTLITNADNNLQLGTTSGATAKLFVYANNSVGDASNNATIYVRQDGSNNIQAWAGSGGNIRAYITSSGTFYLDDDNLVFNTTAKGVNFTANTPASGMTSQLLSWYEQGTWTPANSAMTVNSGTWAATGTYTRTGNLVYFNVLQTSGTVSANSTVGLVSGLPFTPAAQSACVLTNGAASISGAALVETNGIIYGALTFTSQTALRISGFYRV